MDAGDRRHRDISALTGLRGVAALLVIISHYWIWARATPVAALPTWLEPWTATSGIGMAIFFTLSGYVIALSYGDWDWRERPVFNLVRLFFYRFARLYPAFFVFAIVVVLRSQTLRDLSDPQAQAYLWPHLLLWQTWLPVKFEGELPQDDHFHVSWSLSVECALYLMFGLGAIVAAALPRWRYKPLFLAVLFFVSVWQLLPLAWASRHWLAPAGWTDWDWGRWLFSYSPYAVSLQFGIGVAAQRLSRLPLSNQSRKASGDLGALALVAVYLLVGTGQLVNAYHQALFVSLATSLVLIGALASSIANRFLSGRGLVYLGTISYSLYLFHFLTPDMSFQGQQESFDFSGAAYHVLHAFTAFALAVMLATGAYRLVEVPGRRAIRAAADRLLGTRGAPLVVSGQGAPAE